MADNEELIDYDEEEVGYFCADLLTTIATTTNTNNAFRLVKITPSHSLPFDSFFFLSILQVDETLTSEKAQAGDDGKEVKK